MGLFRTILTDLRRKARWSYECDRWPAVLKVLVSDGTLAMILYRLMQWSQRYHLGPLAMLFNKLNAVLCNCIIGRGAEFGPGFVLIHATGVVINGNVRGGSDVYLEHQVTIGAERRQTPVLGSDVFVGAGAKVIGAVTIGDGARIGANAVVVKDIPAYATAVGIPARVVRQRQPKMAAAPSGEGLEARNASEGIPIEARRASEGSPSEARSASEGLPSLALRASLTPGDEAPQEQMLLRA